MPLDPGQKLRGKGLFPLGAGLLTTGQDIFSLNHCSFPLTQKPFYEEKSPFGANSAICRNYRSNDL
jgi:hypothetical protein